MNILGMDYTLKYNSLDIYVSGCSASPHCIGCHNPESWNFDMGVLYNSGCFTKIKTKVKTFNSLINNIMIFGGEPLDQNLWDLLDFLTDLKTLDKKIWLFTRYNIDEIPTDIKELCSYIKTGRYIKELKTDNNIQYGIKLSTSNQKITNIGDNK